MCSLTFWLVLVKEMNSKEWDGSGPLPMLHFHYTYTIKYYGKQAIGVSMLSSSNILSHPYIRWFDTGEPCISKKEV